MSRRDPARTPRKTRPKTRPDEGTRLYIDVLDNDVVQVISERPLSGSSSEQLPGSRVAQQIISTPLHPALYDGTFRYDQGVEDDSPSELSFSTKSSTSVDSTSLVSTATGDEMTLEESGVRPVFSVPIVELPSRQSDLEEGAGPVRRQSISVVGKVQHHAVGAVIDQSSTVLMQLSKGEVFGHQQALDYIHKVNRLLENEESVVILKYPGWEEEQSSKRIREDHLVTTKRMMEMTEDVLRRVQGSSRESILMRLQSTLEEILQQPDETIVVHSYSRQSLGIDEAKSEAMIGFFGREDEAALFVHVPDTVKRPSGSWSDSEAEGMSLDQLRNFLQESLINQDETMDETLLTEPDITISKSGNTVLAVMSFPNASSAVVTTKSGMFPLESSRSEMIMSVKDLFRELVEQPNDKLLVQVHSNDERGTKVEQLKQELDQTLRTGDLPDDLSKISVRQSEDKIIGKLSYSGGSIVIQTTSKNWAKPPNKTPAELVDSIRMIIEQFIITNEFTQEDTKNIASILVQVFHCETEELPNYFLDKPVEDKIRTVVQQLMKPSEDEDPLYILGQVQATIQEICREQAYNENTDVDYKDLLKSYFEGLICDEDSEFFPDSILPALRQGLLTVLAQYESSLSSALSELVNLLKSIPGEAVDLYPALSLTACPGTTTMTSTSRATTQSSSTVLDAPSQEVIQKVHDLLTADQPTTVSHVSTFHALFVAFLQIIASWTLRVKSFLSKEHSETAPLESEPSLISKKPSVSFHLVQDSAEEETPPDISRQLAEERTRLNETIDNLRTFLEQTLEVPTSWQQDRQGSLLKIHEEDGSNGGTSQSRMLQLLSKLLEESAKLKVSDHSANTVRLQLESVSIELERKEDDQFVLLNGSIRDRGQNLGLFFEARLVDLDKTSNMESELECVTEVKRLSDDLEEDQRREAANAATSIVKWCLATVVSLDKAEKSDGTSQRADTEDELKVDWSRYFELVQNHIQESVEPLKTTMERILERLATTQPEKIREIRSSIIQTGSDIEQRYTVELDESLEEVPCNEIAEEIQFSSKAVQHEECKEDTSIPAEKSSSERLTAIENDLSEIKQLMQLLLVAHQLPTASQAQIRPDIQELGFSVSEIESSAPLLHLTEELSTDGFDRRLSEASDESENQKDYISAVECLEEYIDELVSQQQERERIEQTFPEELDHGPVELQPNGYPIKDTIGILSESVPSLSEVKIPPTPPPTALPSGEEEISKAEQSEEQICTPTADAQGRVEASIDEVIETLAEVAEELKDKLLEDRKAAEVDVGTPESAESIVVEKSEVELLKDREVTLDDQETQESIESIVVEESEVKLLEDHKAAEVDQGTQESTRSIVVKESEEKLLEDRKAAEDDQGTQESTRSIVEPSSLDVDGTVSKDAAAMEEKHVSEIQEQPESEQEITIATDQRIDITVEDTSELIIEAEDQQIPRDSKSTIIVEEAATESQMVIAEKEVVEETGALLQQAVPTEISLEISEELALETIDSVEITDEPVAETIESSEITEEIMEENLDSLEETVEPSQIPSSELLEQTDVPDVSQVQDRSVSFVQSSEESPRIVTEIIESERISSATLDEPNIVEERKSWTFSSNLSESQGDHTVSRRPSTVLPKATIADKETRSPKLCDLALSYRCRWAEVIDRRFDCPAEIYSCHKVGHNQLMLHWNVSPKYLEQIRSYDIYVDGQKLPAFFSHKRKTTLIDDIDTNRKHLITI